MAEFWPTRVDVETALVDQVLLGRGRRLFGGPAEAPSDLRLVEARTFGSGVVLLRHERLRSG